MNIKKIPFSGDTIFTEINTLANKYNAVNLGQGAPDFEPSPLLMDIFAKKIRTASHQYAPAPGAASLRRKIADMTKEMYEAEYDPDTEITITPGATAAISTALSVLINPGDKVIIFEPSYDSYRPSILMCGGHYAAVPLKNDTADWDVFDRHFDGTVKAVIVNSPHNPTGKILGRNFFLSLADRLHKTNTVVISDEVYEHITFDDTAHFSASSLPGLYERSFVISSFGKTFHVTGWRIGSVKAPRQLTTAFRNVYQYQIFSVNSVVQEVIATFLEHKDEYLRLGEFYQEKRDYMLKQLQTHTLFEPETPQGTYFITSAYNKISALDDKNFCVDLLKKHNVALIPMSPFYTESGVRKRVRFCFAKTNRTIDAAIENLSRITTL